MAVSTAVADDKTSFATITVFLQFTKEITDRKSYQFTNECGFTDECGSLKKGTSIENYRKDQNYIHRRSRYKHI